MIAWLLVSMIGPCLISISIWVMLCIYRTHTEVFRLLVQAQKLPPPACMMFLQAMERVTFSRHLWLRASFRNPMPLYPKIEMFAVTPEMAEQMMSGRPETMQ